MSRIQNLDPPKDRVTMYGTSKIITLIKRPGEEDSFSLKLANLHKVAARSEIEKCDSKEALNVIFNFMRGDDG